jgi:hypothetical protein
MDVNASADRHRRDDGEGPERRAFDWLERDELTALSAPVPAPDLTEEIMGRLGYQRAEEGAARRQRARRRLLRAATTFAALLAIAGGMHYYTLGQRAQRAELPTIQNAVSTSLEESRRAVSDFSRALRTILTPQLAPSIDQNGDAAGEALAPADHALHQFERMRQDAERLQVSRVRWSGLL